MTEPTRKRVQTSDTGRRSLTEEGKRAVMEEAVRLGKQERESTLLERLENPLYTGYTGPLRREAAAEIRELLKMLRWAADDIKAWHEEFPEYALPGDRHVLAEIRARTHPTDSKSVSGVEEET